MTESKEASTSEAEAPAPLTAEDITVPEGFEANEEALASFLEVANNTEFTPAERTNAMLAMHAESLKAAANEAIVAFVNEGNEQRAAWRDEVKKLPELGGANLDATLDKIDSALAAVLPEKSERDALKGLMDKTGLGDHPLMVRALAAFAEQFAEPTPPGERNAAPAPKTVHSTLYPTMGT